MQMTRVARRDRVGRSGEASSAWPSSTSARRMPRIVPPWHVYKRHRVHSSSSSSRSSRSSRSSSSRGKSRRRRRRRRRRHRRRCPRRRTLPQRPRGITRPRPWTTSEHRRESRLRGVHSRHRAMPARIRSRAAPRPVEDQRGGSDARSASNPPSQERRMETLRCTDQGMGRTDRGNPQHRPQPTPRRAHTWNMDRTMRIHGQYMGSKWQPQSAELAACMLRSSRPHL